MTYQELLAAAEVCTDRKTAIRLIRQADKLRQEEEQCRRPHHGRWN